MSRGKNALMLPAEEAFALIRRRREEAAKNVATDIPEEAWQRAFEAVILFYEKAKDSDMADLLRLDLDRFTREHELTGQVKWDKQKEQKTG